MNAYAYSCYCGWYWWCWYQKQDAWWKVNALFVFGNEKWTPFPEKVTRFFDGVGKINFSPIEAKIKIISFSSAQNVGREYEVELDG